MTPLQYEEVDGKVFLGARRVAGTADAVTDPGRVADFLELRLRRHPRMVGMMLRNEGMGDPPTREDLERYAEKLTMAVITPRTD